MRSGFATDVPRRALDLRGVGARRGWGPRPAVGDQRPTTPAGWLPADEVPQEAPGAGAPGQLVVGRTYIVEVAERVGAGRALGAAGRVAARPAELDHAVAHLDAVGRAVLAAGDRAAVIEVDRDLDLAGGREHVAQRGAGVLARPERAGERRGARVDVGVREREPHRDQPAERRAGDVDAIAVEPPPRGGRR